MPSEGPSDAGLCVTVRLVEAAQAGDERALEKLFERHLPRVRQIVALRLGWKLGQVVELEDVVQETMLQVFQGLGRFESRSEGGFRHWLASCVQAEITRVARRTGARKRGGGRVCRFTDLGGETLHSSIFAGTTPTPSAVARAGETSEALEEALLGMPEHYREIVVLRSLCGMSYREIAEEMGFAEETGARMACSRALRKLKEAAGI